MSFIESFDALLELLNDLSGKTISLQSRIANANLQKNLREGINPQSGAVSDSLSKKLKASLSSNFKSAVSNISDSRVSEPQIVTITDSVSQTIEDPVVDDLISLVPFGETIKEGVRIVSGVVSSIFGSKDYKNGKDEKIKEELQTASNNVLKDFEGLIAYYEKLILLDNTYSDEIRSVRDQLAQINTALLEICDNLVNLIKKIDEAFSVESLLKANIAGTNQYDISKIVDDLREQYDEKISEKNEQLESLNSEYKGFFFLIGSSSINIISKLIRLINEFDNINDNLVKNVQEAIHIYQKEESEKSKSGSNDAKIIDTTFLTDLADSKQKLLKTNKADLDNFIRDIDKRRSKIKF